MTFVIIFFNTLYILESNLVEFHQYKHVLS